MRVATHDGTFHADEVFAIAALELAGEPLEVVRTRERAGLDAADMRVDVGLRYEPDAGDFDHHQRGFSEQRPNGVRFASFGLIWRTYGVRVCGGSQEVADIVDATLVQGVDAQDAGQELTAPLLDGVRAMTLGGVIGGFNPRWDEDLTDAGERARFDSAVDLARGVLEREVAAAAAGARATALVRDAIAAAEDPRIVELPANLPFKRVVATEAPRAEFVIYPKRQGFGVEAVPVTLGSFANRRDLPEAWAGLEGDALVAASGVPDALFCHAKRFLVVARTRAAAFELARRAIGEQ